MRGAAGLRQRRAAADASGLALLSGQQAWGAGHHARPAHACMCVLRWSWLLDFRLAHDKLLTHHSCGCAQLCTAVAVQSCAYVHKDQQGVITTLSAVKGWTVLRPRKSPTPTLWASSNPRPLSSRAHTHALKGPQAGLRQYSRRPCQRHGFARRAEGLPAPSEDPCLRREASGRARETLSRLCERAEGRTGECAGGRNQRDTYRW